MTGPAPLGGPEPTVQAVPYCTSGERPFVHTAQRPCPALRAPPICSGVSSDGRLYTWGWGGAVEGLQVGAWCAPSALLRFMQH